MKVSASTSAMVCSFFIYSFRKNFCQNKNFTGQATLLPASLGVPLLFPAQPLFLKQIFPFSLIGNLLPKLNRLLLFHFEILFLQSRSHHIGKSFIHQDWHQVHLRPISLTSFPRSKSNRKILRQFFRHCNVPQKKASQVPSYLQERLFSYLLF